MDRTGVEYFSWGIFSSSTGEAARYFTDGWFLGEIHATGITELFVDGMFNDAGISAENIFTFGQFYGVVGAGEGAELIWSHILYNKNKSGQFIPI